MATQITFQRGDDTWTKVTVHPEKYRLGVFGFNEHGFHIALGFVATPAEGEALALAKAEQYSNITIAGPVSSTEVPDRLARRASCGIEWEG
jgi:hypothetical protein